jgi:SAM-dependent methyltransferase
VLSSQSITDAIQSAATDQASVIYLEKHRHEYERTVRDVMAAVPPPAKVLELGCFFGAVCFALNSRGYELHASDVPEYITDHQEKFARYGIKTYPVRLEDFRLPFEDESVDAVIMCEVLEHLNFNPLPLIKEINRILRSGGLFYLSLPNGASIHNRIKVLKGKPIGDLVANFYRQITPGGYEITYGHWREYTADEIRRMLVPLGFRIDRHYFFSLGETQPTNTLRKKAARYFYKRFPSLKENQTVLAFREKRTDIPFRIPQTILAGLHRSDTARGL